MAHGSRKRALLVGTGAVLLFGGWALFANREHPVADMTRAALAQGAFSFVSSTCSVLLLEYLYSRGRTPAQKVILGAIGTPAIILLAMTAGHVVARTPNVVVTLLPSWISGTIFCVVYTLNLRRLVNRARTRSEA
jgi:hypothetical protein